MKQTDTAAKRPNLPSRWWAALVAAVLLLLASLAAGAVLGWF
jgi:hypothetical protein